MPTSKATRHRRGVPGGNPDSRSRTRGAAKSAEGPRRQMLSEMLFSSQSPFRSLLLDGLQRLAHTLQNALNPSQFRRGRVHALRWARNEVDWGFVGLAICLLSFTCHFVPRPPAEALRIFPRSGRNVLPRNRLAVCSSGPAMLARATPATPAGHARQRAQPTRAIPDRPPSTYLR